MIDRLSALERLSKLKADGALTDEEFAAQKEAILAIEPSPIGKTFGERWQEGQEKTRGVRRFFRWFWGIQLVAIVLLGIYFLTRGQTLQDARDATNAIAGSEASNVSVPAAAAAAAAQADIIVTDLTLARRPDMEGLGDEPNPLTFCANTMARVANSSSRTLNLQASVRESDISWNLGVVQPSGVLEFDVGDAGYFALVDLSDGKPITGYDVANCDSQGKFL